jgi:tetratricopeptide (TPR) repeat protein
MLNRFYAANLQGIVAENRHDLAKAATCFTQEEEAARYYARFNPADQGGWSNLATSLQDTAKVYAAQGRVADALAKYHESAELEHDPRNKAGIGVPVLWAWNNITELEAQRGNLRTARASLAESARALPLVEKHRNIDEELSAISAQQLAMYELDLAAAEGDYAKVHAGAVQVADQLAKIKKVSAGNGDFRGAAVRRCRVLLSESALRLGNFEEAVTATKEFLDHPQFSRFVDRQQIENSQARAKVRLGQALIGAGRPGEALGPLHEAETYFRGQQAAGATDTDFRMDFARTLYQLARAQAEDPAGHARRVALLGEAEGVLDGLSFETRQFVAGKELIQWVRNARVLAGG